jgi:hypothetical protein
MLELNPPQPNTICNCPDGHDSRVEHLPDGSIVTGFTPSHNQTRLS